MCASRTLRVWTIDVLPVFTVRSVKYTVYVYYKSKYVCKVRALLHTWYTAGGGSFHKKDVYCLDGAVHVYIQSGLRVKILLTKKHMQLKR